MLCLRLWALHAGSLLPSLAVSRGSCAVPTPSDRITLADGFKGFCFYVHKKLRNPHGRGGVWFVRHPMVKPKPNPKSDQNQTEKKQTKQILKLCVHNRLINRCGECGTLPLCVHNRRYDSCSLCGKRAMCVHNHRMDCCGECANRNQIRCIHQQRADTCGKCGLRKMCKHKKRSDSCPKCAPKKHKMCEKHQIPWARCSDCNLRVAVKCDHNIPREKCVHCAMWGLCPHLNIRSYCRECLVDEKISRASHILIGKPRKPLNG